MYYSVSVRVPFPHPAKSVMKSQRAEKERKPVGGGARVGLRELQPPGGRDLGSCKGASENLPWTMNLILFQESRRTEMSKKYSWLLDYL